MGKGPPELEMMGEGAWPPSPQCGPGPGPADGGWPGCTKGSVRKTAPGRVSGGHRSSVAAGGEQRPPPRDGPSRAVCSWGDGEHHPERCSWLGGLASLLGGHGGEACPRGAPAASQPWAGPLCLPAPGPQAGATSCPGCWALAGFSGPWAFGMKSGRPGPLGWRSPREAPLGVQPPREAPLLSRRWAGDTRPLCGGDGAQLSLPIPGTPSPRG